MSELGHNRTRSLWDGLVSKSVDNIPNYSEFLTGQVGTHAVPLPTPDHEKPVKAEAVMITVKNEGRKQIGVVGQTRTYRIHTELGPAIRYFWEATHHESGASMEFRTKGNAIHWINLIG